jgi:hypothetical protein
MKRVVVFLVLLVVLDRGIAVMLDRVHRQTMTGDRGGLLNYALSKDAQVLVLGSSRAQLHIMPSILSQKLGMTSYNAGLKGQDFLHAVMFYDLWKRRHAAPKVIVLTTDIESMIPRENEIPIALIIAPYIGESPLVREILYSGSRWKFLEFQSHAYRFNGSVLSMAKHAFKRPPADYDGFTTSEGSLDPEKETGVLNAIDQDRTALEMAKDPFSPTKVGYLRALAEEAGRNGTRLFLLHTPLFRQDEEAHRLWLEQLNKTLATMPGIQFIDICTSTHPDPFLRPDLYRNLNHVNGEGAKILTGLLADEIKKRTTAP